MATTRVRPTAFGNALGDSLAAEASRGSQQEDALGQFIDEQLQAQARRDFYSLASAPNAPYVRLGGSPDKAVQEWSDDIDTMIRNRGSNKERMDAYLAASTADAGDAIKRQLQRLDGTVRGAAQWVYNGASFLNDQGWAAANAVSGGWLAENNDAARAAVERNAALGRGLLSLPEKASVTALRAVTGNFTLDEVGQGVNRALRTEEIAALEARGDYAGAQAIRTENALNVVSFAVGAAPAARNVFSFAGSTGEAVVLGSRIAVEDFASSSAGQRLALQMERFNYELGLDPKYVVEPKFSLGSTSQTLDAARNRLGQLALIEPDVTRNLVEMASNNGGQMLGLEYRLKSVESLARKMNDQPGIPVNDALRYTMSFDETNFTAGTKAAMGSLQEQGYQLTALRNTFNAGQPYKGINATYLTPGGDMFELQFHTPASFQMKDVVNHPLYEQQRVLPRTDPAWTALRNQMIQNSSSVPIPPGASSIKLSR